MNILAEIVTNRDEETARLLREATRLGAAGDYDSAVDCLRQARVRMERSKSPLAAAFHNFLVAKHLVRHPKPVDPPAAKKSSASSLDDDIPF